MPELDAWVSTVTSSGDSRLSCGAWSSSPDEWAPEYESSLEQALGFFPEQLFGQRALKALPARSRRPPDCTSG